MSLSEVLFKRRRTIRAAVNPMDKCTVVSVFPSIVKVINPTIEPGRFIVPMGSVRKPSLLVVGPSSWWKEIDFEQPLIEVVNGSPQIANSIVKDYCSGLLGCNMVDSMPGIFWVPGAHVLESIYDNFFNELAAAIKKQEKYWSTLVTLADGLWSRSNGHPLSISKDMRLAARELNLTDSKDWMKDFKISSSMSQCPACGNLRKTDFPICASCNTVVDRVLYDKLGLSPVGSARTEITSPVDKPSEPTVDDLKR